MPDHSAIIEPGGLTAVAAIIIGFGVNVIMFRVQRELHMEEVKKEQTWIIGADSLILASVACAFLAVILVILSLSFTIALAACASAMTMQAGFIPAIFAHYRICFGKERKNLGLPRERSEPAEKWIVGISVVIALIVAAAVLVRYHCWP